MSNQWSCPRPGDVVWTRFPEESGISPGPKARPAVVLAVGKQPGIAEPVLRVAYGTSQHIDRLYPGEVLISERDGVDVLQLAGLDRATKFALGKVVELPFNAIWFEDAPRFRFGRHPKMGVLHPILLKRFRDAAVKVGLL